MDRDMKQRFRERFDEFAVKRGGAYDAGSGKASIIKQRQRSLFFDLAKQYRPGLALDMGCGAGLYGGLLLDLGWRVMFGDMSMEMLKLRREHALGYAVQADAEYPPVAGDSLDMVLLFDLFHYFTDEERGRMITAYAKSLRPGGTIFLDVKNRRCPYYSLSRWASRHGSPHAETYSVAELRGHFRAAGMRVTCTRGVPLGGPFAPIVVLSAVKES